MASFDVCPFSLTVVLSIAALFSSIKSILNITTFPSVHWRSMSTTPPLPLTVIWFDSTWTSDFRCWPIICQSCSISPLDGKKSKWLAAGIGLLVRFLKHIHNCISNRKPFIASCPLVSHFIMPTRAAVMQGAQKINNLLAVEFFQMEHFDRYYCVYANKLIANTWRLVMCRTQAR